MPDRDNQKQRVYDAENYHLKSMGIVSAAGRRYLGKQTLTVHGAHTKVDGKWVHPLCCDDKQLMKYVDHVLNAAWFKRRWGNRRLRLEDRARTTSHGGFGRISVTREHRRIEAVVLHEIAHNLTPPGVAWHGPEFAAIFHTLVRYQMGKEAGDVLRAGYKKYRVRTKPSAVPKPPAKPKPLDPEHRAALEKLRDQLAAST